MRTVQPAVLTLYLLLTLITGIGFALRVSAQGESAIWWDEAWSVWVAQQPFEATTRLTAMDVHPPLYQWVLHGWVRLSGIEPFAVRYLSVLWGVLTVALVYALGTRIGGRRAGLCAALLVALSVFMVRWSQETRMYAQAAFFATLTAYCAVRVLVPKPVRPGWYIALIGAGVGVALTHYLGVVAVGLVNLYWLAQVRRVPRGVSARWVASMLITGGLIGLWVLYALPLTRSGSVENDANPAFVFQLAATLWSAGVSVGVERYTLIAGVFMSGALIGLMLAWRAGRGVSVLLVGLFALVPPLMIYTLGILETRFYSPKPEERYIVIFAPVVIAGFGVALGALWRWRWLAGMIAGVLCVALYGAMYAQERANRYLQDDYTTLFNVVHALAREDEPVLFVSDDRYPLPFYHLNRAAGGYTALTVRGVPAPQGERLDTDALRALIGDASRFWLVRIEQNIQDPQGLVTAWLSAEYTPAWGYDFGYNGVTLYTTGEADADIQSLQTLLPSVTHARAGDVLYAAGHDTLIRLTHAGQVVAQAEVNGWGLVTFPVYGAYPSGEYVVSAGESARVVTIHSETDASSPRVMLDADFGALTLLGYSLTRDRVQAGETFEITLHWRVDATMDTDYTVFAQLLGPFTEYGRVWANDDGYPANSPTSALWAGVTFDEVRRLYVPPHMPAGIYEALIGLYVLETGERLTLADGTDALMIPDLRVE